MAVRGSWSQSKERKVREPCQSQSLFNLASMHGSRYQQEQGCRSAEKGSSIRQTCNDAALVVASQVSCIQLLSIATLAWLRSAGAEPPRTRGVRMFSCVPQRSLSAARDSNNACMVGCLLLSIATLAWLRSAGRKRPSHKRCQNVFSCVPQRSKAFMCTMQWRRQKQGLVTKLAAENCCSV